jgi:hypothetical protein
VTRRSRQSRLISHSPALLHEGLFLEGVARITRDGEVEVIALHARTSALCVGMLATLSLIGCAHIPDNQSKPESTEVLATLPGTALFKSVNDEIGRGGGVSGAGAVMVANGMLYVISSSESPAVLLAFSKAHSDV